MYLWIGRNCHPNFLTQVLGVPSYAAVPDNLVGDLMLYQAGRTSVTYNTVQLQLQLHSLHPPLSQYLLPELDTAESQRTRAFIGWLRDQRPFFPSLHVIRWAKHNILYTRGKNQVWGN